MFSLVSYILLRFLTSIKLLRTDQLKSSLLSRFTVFLVLRIYAVILHYHLQQQEHRLVLSSNVRKITRDGVTLVYFLEMFKRTIYEASLAVKTG